MGPQTEEQREKETEMDGGREAGRGRQEPGKRGF